MSNGFQAFVERRLDEKPGPAITEATGPRYFVGAAEVLVDILLAAIPPELMDAILKKFETDAATGDRVALDGLRLLNHWASTKATGSVITLAATLTEDEIHSMGGSIKTVFPVLASMANADQIATLDAVLTVKSGHQHRVAMALKVMLDSAVRELSSLTDQAVRRASAGHERSVAQPQRVIPPRAATGGAGGCYIATAVYGSYDAPEVVILRRFRDERLGVSVAGRALIQCYYAFSPRLARRLEHASALNRIARRALDRVVSRLDRPE